MIRSIFILFVACTLVIAMVPRHRRTEESENTGSENAGSEKPVLYCASQTPCAWSIYKKGFKNLIEQNVTNTYCVCTDGQSCAWSHDDEVASVYVFRCIETS